MALVLQRKETESIHLGDDVVITVTEIKGNRVKLAIEAPSETRILRHEVWLEEQGEAA